MARAERNSVTDIWPDSSVLLNPTPEMIVEMDEDEQREAIANIHRWATRMQMRVEDIKGYLIWKFGPDWSDDFEAYLRMKLDGGVVSEQ